MSAQGRPEALIPPRAARSATRDPVRPARDPAWHWPRFDAPLCGAVDDRQRLGLPACYVPGRFDESLPAALRRWRGASVARLVDATADTAMPLAERIAAGRLLAVAGDPRIDPLSPQMVEVPGGAAHVGLAPEDVDAALARLDGLGLERRWIEKECPRHAVSLRPFRLGRFPVTNAEWRRFLLESGHPQVPTSWECRQFPHERANHPVYTVSAAAADAYAAWLARRTGRGFRLPTEAEWEWAAAGPHGHEFPWGDDFDADLANTAETGLMAPTAVGVFPGGASPCGALDMAGNVEEYVADDYAPYPGGAPVDDHLMQIHGRYRVARGGSFARFPDLARTRRRHGHNPRSATYAMGLRLAEDA